MSNILKFGFIIFMASLNCFVS